MDTVLVLRTCKADMTSYNGFQWPISGPVECLDWSPEPICGQGLHGLLWGEGDGSLLSFNIAAIWQVVSVCKSDIVQLHDKVKFPRGNVVFAGDRKAATDYLLANGGFGRTVVGATVVVGDRGTATAGYRGTATAGYRGTAMAGDGGTATAGDLGTATAGDGGTATAGNGGTATAGDGGTATAGDGGTAMAGYRGTATSGYRGTATAGNGCILQVKWWDGNRYRVAVGYVGEDGIEPNKPYQVDSKGKFIKA